ncbi:unnamed protein product [Macrosiphum euphorbiae]|uniref:Uncharacterized protein n=2 Tax=Macrosiphum euphorbiae TaxID=13131 RepID=A0AAV0XM26_9HEMI|nr:unnamed protein product [Macrosiphum euphorbiae]
MKDFQKIIQNMRLFISVHPKYLKQTKKEEFIIQLQNLKSFYGEFIENIEEEGLVWYNMWKEKNDNNLDFLNLLDEVTFLPSIKKKSFNSSYTSIYYM